MKLTTRLFLLLTLLLLPTGCTPQTASITSNFDDLVRFNENGIAVIRGSITGDWACSTVNGKLRATLTVDVPVLVDGIESSARLLFTLTFDTQLASGQTPYTNVRDYLAAHPDSSTFDAFPLFQTVEVTFIKGEWDFEAVSIRQVDGVASMPEMKGILSTNIFSEGTLEGTINGGNWGDIVTWTLSVPITVQGMQASILIPLQADDKTKVIAQGRKVAMDAYHPGGQVRVEFKRNGDTLQAIRFTEMR